MNYGLMDRTIPFIIILGFYLIFWLLWLIYGGKINKKQLPFKDFPINWGMNRKITNVQCYAVKIEKIVKEFLREGFVVYSVFYFPHF